VERTLVLVKPDGVTNADSLVKLLPALNAADYGLCCKFIQVSSSLAELTMPNIRVTLL